MIEVSWSVYCKSNMAAQKLGQPQTSIDLDSASKVTFKT